MNGNNEMKPNRNDIDIRLEEEAINPIAEFCVEHRGTISRIHEAYMKATGRKMNRDSIERWLHKDPAQRQSPRLGSGLLLMEVSKKVMAEVLAAKIAKESLERRAEVLAEHLKSRKQE